MVIQCHSNRLIDIQNAECKILVMENVHQSEVALEIGRQYVVYGVLFRSGIPWYYVCEDDSDEYPHPHFGGFFQVTDPQLSSCWELYWSVESAATAALLPREWGQNLGFYELLVDGSQLEIETFQRLKSLMDKEAEKRVGTDPL
jgi:hypothetical protein